MKILLRCDAPQRLDVFIAANSAITRSYAEKLIEKGLCSINDVPAKKSGEKLKAGDEIALTVPETVTAGIEKKDIAFDISNKQTARSYGASGRGQLFGYACQRTHVQAQKFIGNQRRDTARHCASAG